MSTLGQQTDQSVGNDQPDVRVSKEGWRKAAGGATVLLVVCVCGLIAQTSIAPGNDGDQSDPLASLALVLAILAFVIQIVTYAIQTGATNDALRRGEAVNAETLRLLGEVSASAELMKQTQTDQLNRFIDNVLDSSSTTARADESAATVSDSGSAPKPMGEASENSPRRTSAAEAAREALRGAPGATDEDRRIINLLQTYPPRDEAEAAVEKIRSLPMMAVVSLTKLAENEAQNRSDGRPVGLVFQRDSPIPELLMDAGLGKNVGASNGNERAIRLTDLGRATARVLSTKIEGPPEWWSKVIKPLWS